jgi:hypothetical protein
VTVVIVVTAAAVELLLVAVTVVHVAGLEVMEVIWWLVVTTVRGETTVIAIARIIGVIHVAVEVRGTVEPTTGTDEDAAVEPLRTVVTIGSAVIWGIVIVAIRAGRGSTDVDTNRYLSLCRRGGRGEEEPSGDGRCCEKRLDSAH